MLFKILIKTTKQTERNDHYKEKKNGDKNQCKNLSKEKP